MLSQSPSEQYVFLFLCKFLILFEYFNLLVELKNHINMTNFLMIIEIDVLQHGHCADFCSCTCKQSACLLCIIAYHHELVSLS